MPWTCCRTAHTIDRCQPESTVLFTTRRRQRAIFMKFMPTSGILTSSHRQTHRCKIWYVDEIGGRWMKFVTVSKWAAFEQPTICLKGNSHQILFSEMSLLGVEVPIEKLLHKILGRLGEENPSKRRCKVAFVQRKCAVTSTVSVRFLYATYN